MSKVALYYPWIYLKSGVERVILETAKKSRHEIHLLTNNFNQEQTFPDFKNINNIKLLKKVPTDRSFINVFKGALTIATQKIDLNGYDVLLVQSEGLGDFVNFRNHSKPIVCFCHTPVRPIYDSDYKEKFIKNNPNKKWPLKVYSFFYKIINKTAWKQYNYVIANSTEVKNRIVKGGLFPEHKIEVIYPGVDIESISPSYKYDKFFLYVGRIKWTKNVSMVIDAFNDFKNKYDLNNEWTFKIAGSVDSASEDYLKSLKQKAHECESIEFIISPSDATLNKLYDNCYALLYPSLNEDWGIVPIEAMAFGKPVLAVNSGGPKESILHGKTGYLLDPNLEAFSKQMGKLIKIKDMKSHFAKNSVTRAHKYTWNQFVNKIDNVIDSLTK